MKVRISQMSNQRRGFVTNGNRRRTNEKRNSHLYGKNRAGVSRVLKSPYTENTAPKRPKPFFLRSLHQHGSRATGIRNNNDNVRLNLILFNKPFHAAENGKKFITNEGCRASRKERWLTG